MKDKKSVLKAIICTLMFASLVLLSGCMDMMARKDSSVEITRPDIANVSPNLDFGKISALGIFPYFLQRLRIQILLMHLAVR